jgi:hypothetical protein
MNSLETGAWSTEFESYMFWILMVIDLILGKKCVKGSYFNKDLFAYELNLYICLIMFGLAE